MTACFADAYYFFALLNPRDEAHPAAKLFSAASRRPIVTTAWVLTEVADGLAATPSRNLFAQLFDSLRSNPNAFLVPPDAALFERGIAPYRNRGDKSWSLTDCISFEVMRDHGLTDAFTGDHHFEQAGFVALLKSTT
jgi:predicted nucleic acid-binding protein